MRPRDLAPLGAALVVGCFWLLVFVAPTSRTVAAQPSPWMDQQRPVWGVDNWKLGETPCWTREQCQGLIPRRKK